MKTVMSNYVSPSIEVIDVQVERGFAASFPSGGAQPMSAGEATVYESYDE